MRKILVIVILMVLLGMVAGLEARSNFLPKDGNNVAMQFGKSFVCYSDSIPAQAPTKADSVAISANAVEATVIFTYQAGYIRARATTTAMTAAAYWVYVPAGVPTTISVINDTYIVYKSATGAARFNVIWRKM